MSKRLKRSEEKAFQDVSKRLIGWKRTTIFKEVYKRDSKFLRFVGGCQVKY